MPLNQLRIVKTSLMAQRAALEVIAQNIANASTPNYTRQRPVMAALAATRMVDPTKAGQGVRLEYVQRLWDARLLAQIGFQKGQHKEAETLAYGLESVEGIVGQMDHGLHDALTEFFNAWDELGTDGANMGARAQVLKTATALTDMLHATRSHLQTLSRDAESQLNDIVTRTNALAQRVAELNGQVSGNQGTVGGNTAATQRDQACQELAELLGATMRTQSDGTVLVLVGGLHLVDGVHASQLELVPDATDPSLHHISLQGHLDPPGMTGQARGLLRLRDEQIPRYLARLDQFAQTLADAVNAQHVAGYDLASNAGGDFFVYDPAGAAGTIRVADSIAADSTLIAASEVADTSSDGGNAFAIGALRYQSLFGVSTAEEELADLAALAGAETQATQQEALARQNVVETLEDRYAERYGVSVDEEAVELMKYQKAFIASTRVAQVVNEMMDSILKLA